MAGASEHSYDLFTQQPGRKAETVLVVTPYVEREFFDRLIRELKPKRLNVVIDDGCRHEDVQMIRDAVSALKRKLMLTWAFGSAPGLVHLKLFYIVWRTAAKRTAHTLIFGSRPSSRAAMHSPIDAKHQVSNLSPAPKRVVRHLALRGSNA